MRPENLERNAEKAALVLSGVVHAIEFADQEAGNVSSSSNWFSLIEAATAHAHYLLTGFNLDDDAMQPKAAKGGSAS